VKVLYVGPAVSGRSTSLASVQRMVRERPRDDRADGGGESIADVDLNVLSMHRWLSRPPGRVIPAHEDDIARLLGADAVLFVVDSQRERLDVSLELLDMLRADCAARGRSLDDIPLVFQLNKRDLEPAQLASEEEIAAVLSTPTCRYVSSIATRDLGTREAVAAAVAAARVIR